MARQYRKALTGPRLTPEEMARQGRVLQRAIAVLGASEAIAFINRHDDDLGGRPIDLSIASPQGLKAVEDMLDRMAV
jgi:uncharacterized protein (DUF2384 family)